MAGNRKVKYDTIRGIRGSSSLGGFTLIELLVTLAIIAILVALAYPSYEDAVIRSRRSEGKRMLADVAQRQERYFTASASYADSLSLLGYPASQIVDNALKSDQSLDYYRVSLTATPSGAASTYTLSAVPVGPQTRDFKCGTLSLDYLNRRDASGTNPSTCW